MSIKLFHSIPWYADHTVSSFWTQTNMLVKLFEEHGTYQVSQFLFLTYMIYLVPPLFLSFCLFLPYLSFFYPISLTVSSYPISLTVSSYPVSLTVSSYPISLTVSSYPISLTVSSYPISLTVFFYPVSLPFDLLPCFFFCPSLNLFLSMSTLIMSFFLSFSHPVSRPVCSFHSWAPLR